jgi:hypothetical protein
MKPAELKQELPTAEVSRTPPNSPPKQSSSEEEILIVATKIEEETPIEATPIDYGEVKFPKKRPAKKAKMLEVKKEVLEEGEIADV